MEASAATKRALQRPVRVGAYLSAGKHEAMTVTNAAGAEHPHRPCAETPSVPYSGDAAKGQSAGPDGARHEASDTLSKTLPVVTDRSRRSRNAVVRQSVSANRQLGQNDRHRGEQEQVELPRPARSSRRLCSRAATAIETMSGTSARALSLPAQSPQPARRNCGRLRAQIPSLSARTATPAEIITPMPSDEILAVVHRRNRLGVNRRERKPRDPAKQRREFVPRDRLTSTSAATAEAAA